MSLAVTFSGTARVASFLGGLPSSLILIALAGGLLALTILRISRRIVA